MIMVDISWTDPITSRFIDLIEIELFGIHNNIDIMTKKVIDAVVTNIFVSSILLILSFFLYIIFLFNQNYTRKMTVHTEV